MSPLQLLCCANKVFDTLSFSVYWDNKRQMELYIKKINIWLLLHVFYINLKSALSVDEYC